MKSALDSWGDALDAWAAVNDRADAEVKREANIETTIAAGREKARFRSLAEIRTLGDDALTAWAAKRRADVLDAQEQEAPTWETSEVSYYLVASCLDDFAGDQASAFQEAVDQNRWQEKLTESYDVGGYGVTVTRMPAPDDDFSDFEVITALVRHAGLTLEDARMVRKRVEHVNREQVISGVSLDTAIAIKQGFELAGMTAVIVEGGDPSRRDRIPEHVRHEVWRRDEGRCVVCGSQEKLEFDHIIPLARGGSNTARNIELRCEFHNRSKGATV